MSTYVAIHEDGVTAIKCKEALDAHDQIEFYDIEEIPYTVNLKTGRVIKNNTLESDEDREMLVLEKHRKFQHGSIDVIPSTSEMNKSIIFFLFEW